MRISSLPDFTPKSRQPNSATWNRICDTLERLSDVRGGPGMRVQLSSAGTQVLNDQVPSIWALVTARDDTVTPAAYSWVEAVETFKGDGTFDETDNIDSSDNIIGEIENAAEDAIYGQGSNPVALNYFPAYEVNQLKLTPPFYARLYWGNAQCMFFSNGITEQGESPLACFTIYKSCVSLTNQPSGSGASGGLGLEHNFGTFGLGVSGNNFVLNNTVQYQEICMPAHLLHFGPIQCETNPTDCCPSNISGSGGSGGSPCISVACCPGNPLPQTMTITDTISSTSATLTYSAGYINYPSPGAWLGVIVIPNCGSLYVVLYCSTNNSWKLDYAFDPEQGFNDPSVFSTVSNISVSCSNPNQITFQTASSSSTNASPCAVCALTPLTWSFTADSFTACYASFNGTWLLNQTSPCLWSKTAPDGTKVFMEALGSNTFQLLFIAPLVSGSQGAVAVFNAAITGLDCCSNQILTATSSTCNNTLGGSGNVPATLTLIPNCASTGESKCPNRTLNVTWTTCVPGVSGSGAGGSPITTPCCPSNAIPQTLFASALGTTATLTYYATDPYFGAGTNNVWLGCLSVTCTGTLYKFPMRVLCDSSNSFICLINCNPQTECVAASEPICCYTVGGVAAVAGDYTCSPFTATFTVNSLGNCPTCTQPFTITVTT